MRLNGAWLAPSALKGGAWGSARAACPPAQIMAYFVHRNHALFMSNPLKCDLCSKPATVHLTQILDNKVHKVDLCEDCAQEKGVTDPSGFSLADLLLKASLSFDTPPGIRCHHCRCSA